jgi:hypothetical protein
MLVARDLARDPQRVGELLGTGGGAPCPRRGRRFRSAAA